MWGAQDGVRIVLLRPGPPAAHAQRGDEYESDAYLHTTQMTCSDCRSKDKNPAMIYWWIALQVQRTDSGAGSCVRSITHHYVAQRHDEDEDVDLHAGHRCVSS